MDTREAIEQGRQDGEAISVVMEKYQNLSGEAETMLRLGLHMGIAIGRRLEKADALHDSLVVGA